jgi:nitrite reductase (NADH) small subunit
MTTDTRWIRAATADQVPAREGRALHVGTLELALFNLGDGRFLAVDGKCPHQGGPLCDGIVAGDTVVCPLHAWKVNLVNGSVERPAAITACVHTYPTRLSDGAVLVEIPAGVSTTAA